ncbi:antiviral reverse transcriptase Drt3a [Paracoccus gahaiensis]
MLDPSFSHKTLSAFVIKTDSAKFGLASEEIKNLRLNLLAQKINEDRYSLRFSKSSVNGRPIAQPATFESAVVMRKLDHDLKKLTGIKQADRTRIIRRMKILMAEGIPYTIVRLDIRKFYQTINIDALRKCLISATRTTYSLRRMLDRFLNWCSENCDGIPAGVSLSGLLSEIYLKEFDSKVLAHPELRFYARFVDDIIMITSPNVERTSFFDFLQTSLPQGLEFNTEPNKHYFKKVNNNFDKNSDYCAKFDYLGYCFHVGKIINPPGGAFRSAFRVVKIDISKKKIEKRKRKFILSLRAYLKDHDSQKLVRRYLLLNSGYEFFDQSRSSKRRAGLCNTYPEIDFPSEGLSELQNFYHATLLSPRSSFAARLRLAPVPRAQKKQILALNLQRHVEMKLHFNFSISEMIQLNRCWRHV